MSNNEQYEEDDDHWDPNEEEIFYTTDLIEACECLNLDKVKACIAAGADVHEEHCGFSAINIVAVEGNVEIAKYLVEQGGANVNHRNSGKSSYPLHIAIDNQEVGMVRYLLSAGADVTLRNYRGKTALEHAKRYERLDEKADEIIGILEDWDIDIKDPGCE